MNRLRGRRDLGTSWSQPTVPPPGFAIVKRVHADGEDRGYGTHAALCLEGKATRPWPAIAGWANGASYHSKFSSAADAAECAASLGLVEVEIRLVTFPGPISLYPLADPIPDDTPE